MNKQQGAFGRKHPCCQNPVPGEKENQFQMNIQVFQTRELLEVNHSKPTNHLFLYLSPKIWGFYTFELLTLR